MNENKLFELENRSTYIDDFYESTEALIDDMITLYQTKMEDELKHGQLYTKARIVEISCWVAGYVKGVMKGHRFEKDK